VKTEREKFAGAVSTYCIEGLMGDGKALQAGTSHNLGQNFAKAFDVTYLNSQSERAHVWATSWGVSTRLIGALVMAHGDDKGLVLPPRIAPLQAVLVPIYRSDEEMEQTVGACKRLAEELQATGVRCKVDDRDQLRPGFKFAEWELKGVPLRLEIGPRDVANGEVCLATRHNGEKSQHPMEGFAASVPAKLDEIQAAIFQKALDFRAANTHSVDSWDEFVDCIKNKGGFVRAHWDGTGKTEEIIQGKTKATIRCIPLDESDEPGKCILTGEPSQRRVVFARSY